MKLNSICGLAMIGMGSGEVGERMTELTDVVIESRPAAGVALLEINRPEALNALNMDIRQKLSETVDRLASDAETRVIVIAGKGGNFAAGSDVKVFAQTAPSL